MTLETDLNRLYNILIISQDFTADHTLLDVMMLTGLNIFAPDRSYDLLSKTDFKFDTRNIGGWKGYIERYSKSGAANKREHAAFLNMWLEKYIFCEKTMAQPPTP